MINGILVLLITSFISFYIVDIVKKKYPFVDDRLLRQLFFFHLALAGAYFLYVAFNPSDSRAYYSKIVFNYRGENWGNYYGTSTTFIEFFGFPFVKYLGFSYEGMMALFSFIGYLGFVFFYIFFKENIRFKHQLFGIDLLKLIFFLPNLHFWSSSFGKGALIFLGLGLYFYGISRVKRRIVAIFIGGLIIYHVRPHVMLVVLVSSSIGFMFSKKGISIAWRLLFLSGAVVALVYIYKDVLKLVGIDEEHAITQGLNLTHRASELTKATSGVDITNYSLPMQVFTFLYRPLFIDAPGTLGLIVSFENLFYVAVTLLLLSRLKGILFPITGGFLVKTAFFSFLTVSIALAQIAGNLGLAIRQKSQVMILFLFVIIAFLDEQKLIAWRQRRKRISRVKVSQLPVEGLGSNN
jgi:hypothetical protein